MSAVGDDDGRFEKTFAVIAIVPKPKVSKTNPVPTRKFAE
jgi:hypothetical protein